MHARDVPVIAGLPLFADMREVNLDALLRAAYLQHFPPQVRLIGEGESADFLHVVVDGCVELFASAGRRETTMELVRPVSTFILAAVLKDADYLMSARTLERSRILMIPAEDVRTAMVGDDGFARALARELSRRYRSMVKKLKNQKLRTGVERLANFLLHQQHEQGGGGVLQLPCEKRVIASLLGMTPENLSRAFGTLASLGVHTNGAEVTITDVVALRTFARPQELIDEEEG